MVYCSNCSKENCSVYLDDKCHANLIGVPAAERLITQKSTTSIEPHTPLQALIKETADGMWVYQSVDPGSTPRSLGIVS
jgi:hypothetical protein